MTKVHITLLGKEVLPAYAYIKSIISKDLMIYVICSKETLFQYDQMYSILGYLDITCTQRIVNPFDIQDIVHKCEQIHVENLDANFSYNLTGGTKIMAFGAFKTALEHQSQVFYTDSSNIYDISNGGCTALDTSLSNEEIFILQGQRLSSYVVYDGKDRQLICESKKIKDFINTNKSVYDRFKKCLTDVKNNKIKVHSIISGNDELIWEQPYLTLFVGNKSFELEHDEADMLLFEGRWWEALVADAIHKWGQGKYEIWTSVVFDPKNESSRVKGNAKNEIDVLVNIGNTLIFIECKSGNFDQNVIYKMNQIRETYGSSKSKSVLISYWPTAPDIKEKAKESQVEVIDKLCYAHDIDITIANEMNKILKKLTI